MNLIFGTALIVECIDCGISRTVIATITQDVNFCVNVGALVGDSIVTYNVIGANQDNFSISATYDGTTVTSGPTGVSGDLPQVHATHRRELHARHRDKPVGNAAEDGAHAGMLLFRAGVARDGQ